MSRNYGYGRTPRVNASLIREARIIFQQLHAALGTPKLDRQQQQKPPTNMWDTLKQPEVKVVALTCEPCLRSAVGTPEPAITVSKGFAVCHRHLLARD
jgi:hypothetical protein